MSTLMRPECALEGTCTINPSRVARSRAPGELRLMRAPPERGKATTIPARRPRPAKSSSPRTETWRGLPLHLDVGTQLTFVMRTDVTCRLLALEVFGAGVAVLVVTGAPTFGAADPPGEATPPALAAAASPAPSSASSGQQSAAAAVAAMARLPRVRASLVANKVRSLCADARGVRASDRRRLRLDALPQQNRGRRGKLRVSPSGSRSPRA